VSSSAVPTWELITTKNLELRRRRGLMIAVVALILAPPVVVLGFRLLFHAVDPSEYGPAGNPGVFNGVLNTMASFGFIIAAALGTAAGSTDLTDGMFRNLVITGRSRVALFAARIPAGLAILLPLVALGFAANCLVTTYESGPAPGYVAVGNATIPPFLGQAQFAHVLAGHTPAEVTENFGPAPAKLPPGKSAADYDYGVYVSAEYQQLDPPVNQMVKTGLWLELVTGAGFMVGLGLGALMGERTLSTVLMIILEIILTPILSVFPLPYFLDGQRLVVGVALNQLRPAYLTLSSQQAPGGGGGGPLHTIFGGITIRIPPMPTWAMVSVIVGWIVGWSVIGAWRMTTRDA
jgi:hypothetical protein